VGYLALTLFRIIDLETTAKEPPGEVVETGFCDARLHEREFEVERPVTALWRAERGIPPETRAVHHITDEMVRNRPLFDHCDQGLLCGKADLLAAHKCDFEQQWIRTDKPWICTHKASLRVFPDAPAHSNQALRYWMEDQEWMPRLRPEDCSPPHRTGPDCWVTAHLLGVLLNYATIAEMVQWTLEPKLIPKINFGKHRGATWSELPYDYVEWIVTKSELDDDTKWNARRELDKRKRRLL